MLRLTVLVLLMAVALVKSQTDPPDQPVCECGIFVQRQQGLPLTYGPVKVYEDRPSVECVGYHDIDCKYWCSELWRIMIVDLDFDEVDEETGLPLGEDFCKEMYITGDIPPSTCTNPFIGCQYRLSGCQGNDDWNDVGVILEEDPQVCCNQMGSYVPGCPPAA